MAFKIHRGKFFDILVLILYGVTHFITNVKHRARSIFEFIQNLSRKRTCIILLRSLILLWAISFDYLVWSMFRFIVAKAKAPQTLPGPNNTDQVSINKVCYFVIF